MLKTLPPFPNFPESKEINKQGERRLNEAQDSPKPVIMSMFPGIHKQEDTLCKQDSCSSNDYKCGMLGIKIASHAVPLAFSAAFRYKKM